MRLHGALLTFVLLWPWPARADDWSLTRPARSPTHAPGRARTKGPRRSPPPGDADEKAQLRARYLQVLLKDPSQQLALERLLALYRERDGNLDGLARELAERAAREAEGYTLLLLRGQVDAARSLRDSARSAFEKAAQLAPSAAAPVLAQAQLAREQGDLLPAAELLQQALTKTKDTTRRAEIMQQLALLALERQDFDGAERMYDALAAQKRSGVSEASAYARALAAKGLHQRAVAAYQKAIAALRGDDRVLPPVLLELSRSQLEAGEGEAALATLSRARALAVSGTGVRYEIDQALVEAHRRLGRLAELATKLAAASSASAGQSELLGRIYDELGDPVHALEALRKALAREPRSIETRERVIRILSQQGELGQAISEYRALLRVAPREPRFVIELAGLLMQSGKRDEALALLAQTARQFPRDARIARSLYELYSRWGERARATAVLTQLSRIEPEDPSHLVALGEQLLERGDQVGALALWRRILDAVPDKARAHATLGGTYLDHDMPERALAELEAALHLEPRNLDFVRGLAETLEKLQRLGDAAQRWQEVLELATDRAQKREARRRVARLWAMSGELSRKIAELEHAFGWPKTDPQRAGKPPDAEAGRFLAECYRAQASGRRRGQGDARYLELTERVLERVLELEPGDIDSMQALEHLRALRGNLAGAIDILSRLLLADPKHAAEYLARMAEHALALYRDDDAVGYAERLVALDPSDAKAHERLGDLYRARQDGERAIASYEKSIALDQNAFTVCLQLGELYLSRGDAEKAALVLRRVVGGCPDDELVKRAARSLIQLGLGPQQKRALEQMLLPLALSNAERSVYRAMLVELYDAMARPLIDAAHEAGPAAAAAQAELHAIGQRAIQPLLAALADDDPTQRRIAIDLLGHLHTEHAAAALLGAAERDGDTLLRRRALLAAGSAPPASLAARFAALAAAPERRLRDAAAWALGRTSGPLAVTRLRGLLASNTPAVRGYALLALGRMHDGASLAAFRQVLRGDRSAFVRGAAALALGMSEDRGSGPALSAALRTERGETAAAIVIALGLLGEHAVADVLAEALFANEPGLRRAALFSLSLLARGPSAPRLAAPEIAEPDEHLSLEPWLAAWLSLAPAATSGEVLRAFATELREAAEAALLGPPEIARGALAVLSGANPGLVAVGTSGELAPLVLQLRPALSTLARHPDPSVRAAAVALLGTAAAVETASSVLAALDDGDEQVQIAALDQIGVVSVASSPQALERVAAIAAHDGRWWMRLRAVSALGRAGGELAPRRLQLVLAADPYAFVREAAAAALGTARSAQSVAALSTALVRDPEPRVRLAAARALASIGSPQAEQALQHMDTQTRAGLTAAGHGN